MKKVLGVGVAIVVLQVLLGKWVDGFVEYSLNETEISLMHEGPGYGVSKATNNALMVGLTLIHGANSKGAGIHIFQFYLSFLSLHCVFLGLMR